MKTLACLLLVLGLAAARRPPGRAACTQPTPSKPLLCYYEGRVPIEDSVYPCLCSHIVHTSAATIADDFTLQLDPGVSRLSRALRARNPSLKLLVSLGGQRSPAARSERLTKSPEKRAALAASVAAALKDAGLQGVEVDLQLEPSAAPRKKEALVEFLKALRNELGGDPEVRTKRDYDVTENSEDDVEAPSWKPKRRNATVRYTRRTTTASTGKMNSLTDELGDTSAGLLLLRVPTEPEVIVKRYDLKNITKYIDWFTVPTHNLTDPSEQGFTFHPSRLMGLADLLNTDSMLDLLTGLGAPHNKIIISVPASGTKFTLEDPKQNTPRSPVTAGPEWINQGKLCSLLSEGGWTMERDEDLTAPYAFKDKTWLAFDDHISAGIKGKYALLRDLAGAAVYPLDDDDLGGACAPFTNKSSPSTPWLVGSLHDAFTRLARKSREVVLESLQDEIKQSTLLTFSGDLQLSPYRITRVVDTQGAVHVVRREARTEFECSRQGYFVHPLGCNRFYRCVKFNQRSAEFTVFEYDCPAGLAFDERWEVCVWPGSLPRGSPCTGSSEIAPVPRARYACPAVEGYYADPENCRWFFACLDHSRDGVSPLTAYEFRCPFGLVFDEQKLICDWPWLVDGCGSALRAGAYFGAVQLGAVGLGYGGYGNNGAAFGDASINAAASLDNAAAVNSAAANAAAAQAAEYGRRNNAAAAASAAARDAAALNAAAVNAAAINAAGARGAGYQYRNNAANAAAAQAAEYQRRNNAAAAANAAAANAAAAEAAQYQRLNNAAALNAAAVNAAEYQRQNNAAALNAAAVNAAEYQRQNNAAALNAAAVNAAEYQRQNNAAAAAQAAEYQRRNNAAASAAAANAAVAQAAEYQRLNNAAASASAAAAEAAGFQRINNAAAANAAAVNAAEYQRRNNAAAAANAAAAEEYQRRYNAASNAAAGAAAAQAAEHQRQSNAAAAAINAAAAEAAEYQRRNNAAAAANAAAAEAAEYQRRNNAAANAAAGAAAAQAAEHQRQSNAAAAAINAAAAEAAEYQRRNNAAATANAAAAEAAEYQRRNNAAANAAAGAAAAQAAEHQRQSNAAAAAINAAAAEAAEYERRNNAAAAANAAAANAAAINAEYQRRNNAANAAAANAAAINAEYQRRNNAAASANIAALNSVGNAGYGNVGTYGITGDGVQGFVSLKSPGAKTETFGSLSGRGKQRFGTGAGAYSQGPFGSVGSGVSYIASGQKSGGSNSYYRDRDIPSYASLPDSFVSGGRIDNTGGVVLGTHLVGINGLGGAGAIGAAGGIARTVAKPVPVSFGYGSGSIVTGTSGIGAVPADVYQPTVNVVAQHGKVAQAIPIVQTATPVSVAQTVTPGTVVQPVARFPSVQSVGQTPLVQPVGQVPVGKVPFVQPVAQVPIVQSVTPASIVQPVSPVSFLPAARRPTFQPIENIPVVQSVTADPVVQPVSPVSFSLPARRPNFQPVAQFPIQSVTPVPVVQPISPVSFQPAARRPALQSIYNVPEVQSVTPVPVVQPVSPVSFSVPARRPNFQPVAQVPVVQSVTPVPIVQPVSPVSYLPAARRPAVQSIEEFPVVQSVTPAPVVQSVSPVSFLPAARRPAVQSFEEFPVVQSVTPAPIVQPVSPISFLPAARRPVSQSLPQVPFVQSVTPSPFIHSVTSVPLASGVPAYQSVAQPVAQVPVVQPVTSSPFVHSVTPVPFVQSVTPVPVVQPVAKVSVAQPLRPVSKISVTQPIARVPVVQTFTSTPIQAQSTIVDVPRENVQTYIRKPQVSFRRPTSAYSFVQSTPRPTLLQLSTPRPQASTVFLDGPSYQSTPRTVIPTGQFIETFEQQPGVQIVGQTPATVYFTGKSRPSLRRPVISQPQYVTTVAEGPRASVRKQQIFEAARLPAVKPVSVEVPVTFQSTTPRPIYGAPAVPQVEFRQGTATGSILPLGQQNIFETPVGIGKVQGFQPVSEAIPVVTYQSTPRPVFRAPVVSRTQFVPGVLNEQSVPVVQKQTPTVVTYQSTPSPVYVSTAAPNPEFVQPIVSTERPALQQTFIGTTGIPIVQSTPRPYYRRPDIQLASVVPQTVFEPTRPSVLRTSFRKKVVQAFPSVAPILVQPQVPADIVTSVPVTTYRRPSFRLRPTSQSIPVSSTEQASISGSYVYNKPTVDFGVSTTASPALGVTFNNLDISSTQRPLSVGIVDNRFSYKTPLNVFRSDGQFNYATSTPIAPLQGVRVPIYNVDENFGLRTSLRGGYGAQPISNLSQSSFQFGNDFGSNTLLEASGSPGFGVTKQEIYQYQQPIINTPATVVYTGGRVGARRRPQSKGRVTTYSTTAIPSTISTFSTLSPSVAYSTASTTEDSIFRTSSTPFSTTVRPVTYSQDIYASSPTFGFVPTSPLSVPTTYLPPRRPSRVRVSTTTAAPIAIQSTTPVGGGFVDLGYATRPGQIRKGFGSRTRISGDQNVGAILDQYSGKFGSNNENFVSEVIQSDVLRKQSGRGGNRGRITSTTGTFESTTVPYRSGLSNGVYSSTTSNLGLSQSSELSADNIQTDGKTELGTATIYNEDGGVRYDAVKIGYGKTKGSREPIVVVTRLSDVNPILVAKLGAQCTCRSNAVSLKKPSSRGRTSAATTYSPIEYDATPSSFPSVSYASVNPASPLSSTISSYTPDADGSDLQDQLNSGPVVVTPRPNVLRTGLPTVASTTGHSSVDVEYSSLLASEIEPDELSGSPSFQDSVTSGRRPNLVGGKGSNTAAGRSFDRYGPGGLRGADETLQGSVDCQRPGLFRHPKYCNKFYACHWDEWKGRYTLHVFNCPVQLAYDSNVGACNWPSQGPACADDNLLV